MSSIVSLTPTNFHRLAFSRHRISNSKMHIYVETLFEIFIQYTSFLSSVESVRSTATTLVFLDRPAALD